MSTLHQRTPGRTPGRTAPEKPMKKGLQSPPRNEWKEIPQYTQEELDLDVVAPNKLQQLYERTICLLAFAAMTVYLVWRWRRFVSVPSTYWISLPLVVSETALILPGLFISYFIIWHRMMRPVKRLADMKLRVEELPTVDIFIPCLNEPVDIIRKTLEASANINYPKNKMTICVCDDGKRADVKTMFNEVVTNLRQMGSAVTLKYIARTKDPKVYHHAKAGNLNNAILGKDEAGNQLTQGDFLVIFDCDMICEPTFLEALLPHFFDRDDKTFKVNHNIALVQSPQSFVDVKEHDPLGQQYRYFYGPVLQGWDGADSTPCCGTNVIFSRKCLTEIGGFVYGSVTEDFLTSMYLHNKGFKTKYVHEYLARGLSPDNLHDFMKQRFRWAAGAVEIFFYHNSLNRKGLTWKQTYLYFWAGLQALLAFPLILVCFVPFIALADRSIEVAPNDAGEYLYYMGGFLTFNIWMLFVSYRGVPKLYLMRSVQESVFMLFCKIEAVVQVLLKGKLEFITTKKNQAEMSPVRKDISHIIPHVLYYILSLGALGKVVYNCMEPGVTQDEILGQGVSLIWIGVVLWQLWPPISVVIASARAASAAAKADKAAAATAAPNTPKLPNSP